MTRTGLLLVNLGTPEAPQAAPVRRYLREFLSDPRVIDMNPVGRWLLLNLVILPFRPARSAEAYRAIWTPEGSPLMLHSRALAEGVAAELGQGWVVELAMRYGQPSIPSALAALQAAGVDRVLALPLYPQYASASTGSTVEAIYRAAGALPATMTLTMLPEFYDDPGYLDAVVEPGREAVAGADHVLFSFHGVPERQVRATWLGDAPACPERPGCCDAITAANRRCYRAQSLATARGLAERLGLPEDRWSVGFQSRLGRVPWIRPYTDEVIAGLAARGVKRLAVFCPSFVADCLETLEEIGLRGAEAFTAAGGEALELIPCVNASPRWIHAIAEQVRHNVHLSDPAGGQP